MREHILERIDAFGDEDGSVPLKTVVTAAQERYSTHQLFPKGRVRNDCPFTKVDLEPRCEIERAPGAGPSADPALVRGLMASSRPTNPCLNAWA